MARFFADIKRIAADRTEICIQADQGAIEVINRYKAKTVEVIVDDGRRISPIQRRKIYATIKDISEYTGYDPETAKQIMKVEHMLRTGDPDYFSLADCSMTKAREFINTLMDYCLKEGLILSETGLKRTDDIDTYLIQCLKYKRCCICGRDAETHHIDTIGMGNNRRRLDDSDHEVISLCRMHHTIAHSEGSHVFCDRYHVYGIKRYRVSLEEDNGEEDRLEQDNYTDINKKASPDG